MPSNRPRIDGIRAELPNLLCPIALIIDDGVPIAEDRPAQGGAANRWSILDGFADLCHEHGVRGKFSVLPYLAGPGMVDTATDPGFRRQLDAYVATVTARLLPRFDITPEIISHGPVIDLATGRPFAGGADRPELLNEARWSQTQDEDTLERYIGRALLALRNVGLVANGVTSPWDFGLRVEGAYARAVGRALHRVNGLGESWYFLSTPTDDRIEPRLMRFDREARSYVVSVPASGRMVDMTVATEAGPGIAGQIDAYITADGQGGALPRLIANRSHLILCGHWQCLATGIPVYREVFTRLAASHPGRYRWMECSAIARYHAVTRTFQPILRPDGSWTIESPLPCPDFTIAIGCPAAARRVLIDGRDLRNDRTTAGGLAVGSWRQDGTTIHACFDLVPGASLVVES